MTRNQNNSTLNDVLLRETANFHEKAAILRLLYGIVRITTILSERATIYATRFKFPAQKKQNSLGYSKDRKKNS